MHRLFIVIIALSACASESALSTESSLVVAVDHADWSLEAELSISDDVRVAQEVRAGFEVRYFSPEGEIVVYSGAPIALSDLSIPTVSDEFSQARLAELQSAMTAAASEPGSIECEECLPLVKVVCDPIELSIPHSLSPPIDFDTIRELR